MHAVVVAGVVAPDRAAEQFAGGVGIVADGVEIVHLETEVELAVDVSREEKIDVVLFVAGDEAFLVRDGRERSGGVEETLLLRRDDIGREAPCEGVVDGLEPIVDDAALDGRHEDVAVHGAAEGVELLHIDIVVVEHDGVGKGNGIRHSRVPGHRPGTYHGLCTGLFGSGHKGRCQQN